MAGERNRSSDGESTQGDASWRRVARDAALLLGLCVALLLPALQPGRVLAPVDLYYETPVYAPERPPGYTEPANPHLFDQAYQFVPWRHYAWERLRDGEMPLWNPLSGTGTPFIATLQAAVFYPLNLLTLPLPFAATFVASALLRLWIAGFSLYLLLRRYGSSPAAGLLGGVAFMLCGFIVSWLGHPHTNAAVWLPALVLAVEGLLTSTPRRMALRWWAALALVVGVQLLGGHIETSRDILFAAGLYALVRIAQLSARPIRQRGLKLLAATLAVALGTGIAAVQLLPFIEWLPLSAEYQARSNAGFDVWRFNPETLLALPLAVMPNLYGNPTWDGAYWSFNPRGSFNESVLYAGTLPLALCVAALTSIRRDPVVQAWTLTGGVTLGMALGLPLFDWLNQLPGFALGHPGRLRLIALCAVAVLAGRGLDSIRSHTATATAYRTLMGTLGVIALATGAVLLLFNVVFTRMSNWETRAVARILDHFAGSPNPPRTVLVCRERLAACGEELGAAFAPGNWDMYLALPVALLALALLWMSTRSKRVNRNLAPALLVLSATELLLLGWGYNPAVDDAPLTEPPPALAQAAATAGDGRLTVLQQDTLPDSHMLYGIADVRGLDFKTVWYERYLDASGDRIPWLANGVLLEGAGPQIVALDVDAVVTANPHLVDRLTASGEMRVAATAGDVTILEPLQPVPRAALRYDVQLVDTDADAAGLLAANPDLLNEQALVPNTNTGRAIAERVGPASADAAVVLTRDEPELVRLEAQTSEPALLVISDAYYPGWEATVDGEPVEIVRTNITFRGVLLEPGSHVVEMRYAPASVRWGLRLSILSVIVAGGVLALGCLPPDRFRRPVAIPARFWRQ